MIRDGLSRAIDFVTTHNVITLVVMLVLTVGVLAGIPQIDTASQAGGDSASFEDLDTVKDSAYVQEHYAQTEDSPERTFATVYVRDEDGTVLDKPSLLAGLQYQRAVLDNASVRAALHDDGIVGLSNMVAMQAAGDRNATLDQQIAALEDTDPTQVTRLVERTLQRSPQAQRLLPSDHDGSSPNATDRRMLVALDARAGDVDNASAALYDVAGEYEDAGIFVLNSQAWNDYSSHFFGQMVELVLPAALVLILFVLAFSYRDVVDVVVGMTGVVLSVLWTFGLLGWLGVEAGTTSIVPVVLVSGLSIDFGFHVFNRYREQRGPEESIRAPMGRGVKLVATALVLVTVTAAIGFLANLTNPLPLIRDLGVSITLGVVSALVLFVTVVPALKISIDGLLERIGLDRRKQPLGHGRFLRPVLEKSVTLARRGAPAVLAIALVVGALGGVAWFSLGEESYQQADGDVAEWKQQLPDPIGWEPHPVAAQSRHVEQAYQPASADDAVQEPILIRGDVTGDDTLETLHAGVEDIRADGIVVDQPGVTGVQSPLSAMERLAARDSDFRAQFRAADSADDGDSIPDHNLTALYDAFYAADSDLASQVLERTDGEYRSLLVTVALDADFANADSVVADLADGAAVMEGDGARTASVAGTFAVQDAILGEIVSGILLTMAIALAAIALTMVVVFRYMHGSATLGLVVSLPIALVLGLVIGGMYLLEIPLTLLTALLMSLVIGLGVDYTIHVGDRFADERRAGAGTTEALSAAVTGTGGALLGSTLTSAGAFATIALVPHPQLQSFGAIVVVALTAAFAVSILVLPSLLVLWDRYSPETVTVASSSPSGEAVTQD